MRKGARNGDDIPAENRGLAPSASSAAAFFVESVAAGNQNIVHILVGEAQACLMEELGPFGTRMAFAGQNGIGQIREFLFVAAHFSGENARRELLVLPDDPADAGREFRRFYSVHYNSSDGKQPLSAGAVGFEIHRPH